MKKLLGILLMFCIFSCSPQDVEVKESTKIPYYEIQSKVDTIKYNMVEIDATYYLIVDGVVKKKIVDYYEDIWVFMIIGFALGVWSLLILKSIFDN